MPDLVEGQSIARAILQGAPEGWNAFDSTYGARLQASAAYRLSQDNLLRGQGDARDLVQGFLVEKVLRRPAVMLTPTAEGSKPLWPRLADSFANYCNQLRRSITRSKVLPARGGEAEGPTPLSPAPSSSSEVARSSITQRLAEQTETIRQSLADVPAVGVPLLHLLLLSERLLLAEQVGESFALPDGSLPEGESVPALVESVSGWTPADAAQPLPRRQQALDTVWKQLKPLAAHSPFRVDGNAVASILGVRENLWAAWVRRARLKVIAHAGAEKCQAMFPHWPARLLGSAGRGDEAIAEGAAEPC